MTRHQAVFFRRLIYVHDLVVSVVAFFVALSLRALLGKIGDWFPREIQYIDAGNYYNLVWGLLPLWFLSFFFSNTADVRVGYGRAAARYLRAVAIALALFVTASFAFKLGFVSRAFVLLFGLVHFFALVTGRVVLVEVVSRLRRQQVDRHRVLVVGTGSEAVAFTGSLRSEAPWNHHFVGFVRIPGPALDSERPPEEGLPGPVIGELNDLEAILDREPVDEVVFAVPDRSPEMLEEALLHCDARGVDVLLTMPPDIPKHGQVDMASITGYDLPLIGMRRTSTREGELLVKRMLDLLGGTVGVLMVSPILLFTALAIKLTDPGPIFFRQVRVGRNGRRFSMIKFRSMVVDAEARKRELMKHNEMGGPVFKMKADPRITKVGRFIRKTSIDELPQLFNVLWGQMSLVGPRPPLPDEVAQYKPWQRRRLSVKPGITGLWQVSGRNQVDFDEWMELDLRYIDNWSIWFDIEILLKTIPVVLLRKGAS